MSKMVSLSMIMFYGTKWVLDRVIESDPDVDASTLLHYCLPSAAVVVVHFVTTKLTVSYKPFMPAIVVLCTFVTLLYVSILLEIIVYSLRFD